MNRLAQNGNCTTDHQLLTSKPSHPIRGAWIETFPFLYCLAPVQSHPIRDAWIETGVTHSKSGIIHVTSHTGCVD